MKFSLIFALLLDGSTTRSCVAWLPSSHLHHHSLSTIQNDYSSRQHSTRLAVRPTSSRVPSTEDDVVKSKHSTAFPWGDRNSSKTRDTKTIRSSTAIPNQVDLLEKEDDEFFSPELLAAGAIAGGLAIAAIMYIGNSFDISFVEVADTIEGVVRNPSVALDQVVQTVESMGPLGAVYFGLAYTVAEVLAIPAIPLTASAGYLFGPLEGTAVVLLSASIAAAISFGIGRTFLREYVENLLVDYPKFAKLDRAIGKEGFKLMLLLRLSPIFPFAVSNYLYGASSINFTAFFWGTLLGFAPGTIAYVCTGAFGKALSAGGEDTYPWFVYAGGLTLLGGLLKVLADTATRVVDEMEDDDT